MQVFKFGGSSVANAQNIQKVSALIDEASKKNRVIVVVSALGGITDLLLQCGRLASLGDESFRKAITTIEQRHMETVRELIPVRTQSGVLSMVKKAINEIEEIVNSIYLLGELTFRNEDRLAAYGEWLSSKIIAARLQSDQLDIIWKDARELINTDSSFTNAQVNYEVTNQKISEYFKNSSHAIHLIPGFIAADNNGITTTLGRGGSDYTASLLAAALNAKSLTVWKDVDGMMTADPRVASNAKVIKNLSYSEAMELSHFGAKVLYPPTLQPVMNLGIPLQIRNTFAPENTGTLISKSVNRLGNEDMATGISSVHHIALLTLEGSGMIGIPGISARLFEALSLEKINIILITQSSSEHSICVAIKGTEALKAKKAIDLAFEGEIALKKVRPLSIETDLSIVAVVGEQMKSRPGISGRMFGALGRNGVNIRAIAQGSSEKNISAVVASEDVNKAVNVLHEEFFETTYKLLHLYIMGLGNVGSRLMEQIGRQQEYLKKNLKIKLRIAGIGNSRKMAFNEKGIAPEKWNDILNSGSDSSVKLFAEEIIKHNRRNAVFVDVTANEIVASVYEDLLKKSISVVACNKIAASSSQSHYVNLKNSASHFNSKFLFETNVGAALPVIATLNDLRRSGDVIHRIEAVLSGTLNFVFNHYDGSKKFAEVVKQAQMEGYTEPDPRLDLSGTDVMRKILILAREAGYEMEMEQIENKSFMPASCMEGDVESFYQSMEKEEAHFLSLLETAKAADAKLKFVANFNEGKASVGLQHVKDGSDLYHLYGKDNVVLFYTDRYPDQPLVVKGAGAGAEVTASGVFADIIRAANA